MWKIHNTKKEIVLITQKLSGFSLLEANNFPEINANKIEWTGYCWVSNELKYDNYLNIYSEIISSVNYNFILLDGWIIQMLYEFESNWDTLKSHRLTYYPRITGIQLWEDPSEYEEMIYWIRSFWELSFKDNVSTPIRFDYVNNTYIFQEYNHSYTHLSLWGYKSCRLTTSWPLSPYQFISFVMKHFYHEKYIELNLNSIFSEWVIFDTTITWNEKTKPHLFIA